MGQPPDLILSTAALKSVSVVVKLKVKVIVRKKNNECFNYCCLLYLLLFVVFVVVVVVFSALEYVTRGFLVPWRRFGGACKAGVGESRR